MERYHQQLDDLEHRLQTSTQNHLDKINHTLTIIGTEIVREQPSCCDEAWFRLSFRQEWQLDPLD